MLYLAEKAASCWAMCSFTRLWWLTELGQEMTEHSRRTDSQGENSHMQPVELNRRDHWISQKMYVKNQIIAELIAYFFLQ